jgi:hypothetical protein
VSSNGDLHHKQVIIDEMYVVLGVFCVLMEILTFVLFAFKTAIPN